MRIHVHVLRQLLTSRAAQSTHAQQAHDCEAGDHCVTMADDAAKPGAAADVAASEPVLCTECVKSLGRPAIYCSQRCAGQHFQRHREAVHLPARARAARKMQEAQQAQGKSQQAQGQVQAQAPQPKSQAAQAQAQPQPQSQGQEHNQDDAPVDDSAHVVYENEAKTRYHAADIGALVMRLADALERLFREKHPAVTFLGVE